MGLKFDQKNCVRESGKSLLAVLCLPALILLAGLSEASTMIVTMKAAEAENDQRATYERALIRLALEKTVPEFGAYHEQIAPAMSVDRGIDSLKSNLFTNNVMAFPYDEQLSLDGKLDYVRFPVELGILGVRTCFVSDPAREEFSQVSSFDELSKFVHGQGRSWGDVSILRHNGFKVIEVDFYRNLFRMIQASRFDLFCRGASEVMAEYQNVRDESGINYDRSIAIRYDMPRFFYFNRENTDLSKRLTAGIIAAYDDGSLKELWETRFKESLEFIDIENRRVFNLDNPNLRSVDFNYRKYFADWVDQGQKSVGN